MTYDLEYQQKINNCPPPVIMTEMERDGLILKHMPQIKYIAQRISTKLPAHIELNDLIGTGVLGLLDAIEKFNPNRGVKFKTYAELRIKGAILDSLRNLDWAPRSLRKKSKDLEKVCHDLEQRLGRSASDKEISDQLGLSADEFYELIDQLKGLNLGNFHTFADHDSEDSGDPFLTYIPDAPHLDPFFLFQKSEVKEILTSAIEMLPEKERLVISLYYFDELTMKEIGNVLGVNESRVSQLHTKAMLRLRSKLRKVNDQN